MDWTARKLGIDFVVFETHKHRKKPSPYMLQQVMATWGLAPDEVLFVGDQATDREAAAHAGCDFAWAGEFFE